MRNRVQVIHGVNLDILDKRPPEVYGGGSLGELEGQVDGYAAGLGLAASFWQTNHEGEFRALLHRAPESADALLLNCGAWTHYSYAIRDALEMTALPAVEVHISDIDSREDWRRKSVIRDLCIGYVQGKGIGGYREALELLSSALSE